MSKEHDSTSWTGLLNASTTASLTVGTPDLYSIREDRPLSAWEYDRELVVFLRDVLSRDDHPLAQEFKAWKIAQRMRVTK